MAVFSLKLGRRGSWLVTTVSTWNRSARNFRSAAPLGPVQAVVGMTMASKPGALRISTSARGVKKVRMLFAVTTCTPPPYLRSTCSCMPSSWRCIAFLPASPYFLLRFSFAVNGAFMMTASRSRSGNRISLLSSTCSASRVSSARGGAANARKSLASSAALRISSDPAFGGPSLCGPGGMVTRFMRS